MGATPGRPFLFRIPAQGKRPLRFRASNLPPELTLDSSTGILSGTLLTTGSTTVELSAENSHGQARQSLTLVAGERQLALTPPLGWNSWNVWGKEVDDKKVRQAADAMVQSGLADCGFQYVVIDDGWAGERDAAGEITPNAKFPDMKALADYVHARGLKLGIYSSPGPKTCAGFSGSYGHEQQDAQTWARWGVDYLKYDWCSYGHLAADGSREELRKPYEVMRQALDASPRDIVYSLCQYGMGQVWQWGAEVGGNLWRTTPDIDDSWQSVAWAGFGQEGLEKYAGPGHWNDPDMLVVGRLGWGEQLRPSRLSRDEQLSHVTLWTLLAAPLFLGCDLCQLDLFTLALLTNPEVVEVNQDVLGKQATCRKKVGEQEIWARVLSDGTLAVGLFNRASQPAQVTVKWSDLGMSAPQAVRDLWQRKDLGVFEEAFHAHVAGHGAVLVKVGTPGR